MCALSGSAAGGSAAPFSPGILRVRMASRSSAGSNLCKSTTDGSFISVRHSAVKLCTLATARSSPDQMRSMAVGCLARYDGEESTSIIRLRRSEGVMSLVSGSFGKPLKSSFAILSMSMSLMPVSSAKCRSVAPMRSKCAATRREQLLSLR